MAAASPKPKGGKLTKNKYVIAGVIVVAGALFYFYYKNKNNSTSSAGTSSTPADTGTSTALPSGDSTGGGSGSGPDLSALFGLLSSDNSLIGQLVGSGGGGTIAPQTSTPTPNVTTTNNYYSGGGNTTTPQSGTNPSQPSTSTPAQLQQAVTSITQAQPDPSSDQFLQAIRGATVLSGSGVVSTPQTATSGNPVGATVGAYAQTANDINDVLYSPPLVTLNTTKAAAPAKAAAKPVSGYSQKSGANLH